MGRVISEDQKPDGGGAGKGVALNPPDVITGFPVTDGIMIYYYFHCI